MEEVSKREGSGICTNLTPVTRKDEEEEDIREVRENSLNFVRTLTTVLFDSGWGVWSTMSDEGKTRAPTVEEEDLLRRSTKKAKGADIVDSPMDDPMHGEAVAQSIEDNTTSEVAPVGETPAYGEAGVQNKENSTNSEDVLVGETPASQIPSAEDNRTLVSYKDTLLGFNGALGGDSSDDEDWKERQRKEEEAEDEDDPISNKEQIDPFNPPVHFSKKEHTELCKHWKLTLLVSLMGKRLGLKFLKARLHRLWNIKGSFEFIDLENDYYAVRFTDRANYQHALEDGPWIIAEHYVIVQRWRALFDPFDNKVRKMAI